MNTDFPEDILPFVNINKQGLYEYHIDDGYSICKDKTIIFCGICRDVEKTIELNIERLQRLCSFFKLSSIFIYENDSSDNTVNIINKLKLKYENINFLSETIENNNYRDLIISGQDMWHYNRCCILSTCRNKYIDYIKNKTYDYCCVVDLDIIGGWSYNGFLHSISLLETEKSVGCVSAYGILSEYSNTAHLEEVDPKNYLMYDSFAYRPIYINRGIHMTRLSIFNNLTFSRGEDPHKVMSNFGGMAIYKNDLIKTKKYYAKQWEEGYVDPDHVSINSSLVAEGYDVLLNPNLICSYSKHKYCKDI